MQTRYHTRNHSAMYMPFVAFPLSTFQVYAISTSSQDIWGLASNVCDFFKFSHSNDDKLHF